MGLRLHVSPILDRFPSLQVDLEAEILRYKVCVCVLPSYQVSVWETWKFVRINVDR